MNVLKILLVLLFISFVSFAQDENYVKENYNKTETIITMRDGAKLFTVIYSPKDTSKKYPILFQRTPYSCQPYGEDQFRSKISPNEFLMKEGLKRIGTKNKFPDHWPGNFNKPNLVNFKVH